MINFLPKELTEELGFDYLLHSGYYWVEDEGISYWNPDSHGTVLYKGELGLLEVCNKLNEESKRIFDSHARQLPFEFLEGEDKIQAIVRVRKELGLGLREAKDLVEGNYNFPSSVVIKGGPLDGMCKVSYEYISVAILDVIPLPIEQVIKFSDEGLWELDCSSYSFPYTLMRSINTDTYVQAFVYPDGHIKYELGCGNKDCIVYKGDLDTCLSLSNKFRDAFKEGRKNAAARFLDLSNSFLEE